ncbi:MAG: hypothetical protein ACFB01_03885 [Cohaesibacteraceae bacterium]
MNLLRLPITVLAFLGRHGTLAIAVSLFLGAALPFLAATFRPWLDEAILLLLTLAYLRLGFRALGQEFRTPLPVVWAVALALILIPFAALGIGRWIGLDASHPDLFLALFIALAVPPVTAVPIFAGLLRLPGPIALAFLILAMVVTPLRPPCMSICSLRRVPCPLTAWKSASDWQVFCLDRQPWRPSFSVSLACNASTPGAHPWTGSMSSPCSSSLLRSWMASGLP